VDLAERLDLGQGGAGVRGARERSGEDRGKDRGKDDGTEPVRCHRSTSTVVVMAAVA
jgi:hypothetical protein